MPVSVLIVSFNVRRHLSACLRSLVPAAGLSEVIVVDNASEDGSLEMLRSDHPAVTAIAMDRNRGFAAAVNTAAKHAKGDYLLLLNPDAELPHDALERMVASLEAHPSAAALGVRQVDAHGFFQLAVGPGPSLALELGRKLVQRRLDQRDRFVAALVDRLLSRRRQVPWVAASCLLVRRADFETVGGFDEGYFLYFEDIDFCLRLGQAGRRVLYDPTITIVHHRGASAARAAPLAARAYRDSQGRFWRRHRGGVVGELVAAYAHARRS